MINYKNLTEEQKHYVMNTETFGMDEDDFILDGNGRYIHIKDLEMEMEE